MNHVRLVLSVGCLSAAVIVCGFAYLAAATEPSTDNQSAAPDVTTAETGTSQSLSAMAADRSLESKRRIRALRRLQARSLRTAVDVAIGLTSEPDVEVATSAIDVVGTALDSGTQARGRAPTGNARPDDAIEPRRRESLVDSLRRLTWDRRRDIRAAAAGVLARRSDISALVQIQKGAMQGLYDEVEAISYISLANPIVAEKFLRWYLANGTKPAKLAAISRLSGDHHGRHILEHEYLENQKTSAQIRDAIRRALEID